MVAVWLSLRAWRLAVRRSQQGRSSLHLGGSKMKTPPLSMMPLCSHDASVVAGFASVAAVSTKMINDDYNEA